MGPTVSSAPPWRIVIPSMREPVLFSGSDMAFQFDHTRR